MKMQMMPIFKGLRISSIVTFACGIAGAVLGLTVSPWLFILSAAAVCLPPLLKVYGVLKDSDEFELESIKRGTLLSWVVVCIFLFAWLISSTVGEDPQDFSGIISFLITVQVFSYLMARYYYFWMNKNAGRIIIGIELVFWVIFLLLSAESPASLLFEASAVIVLPVAVIILSFFKPRLSGLVCIAFSIFTMFFFGVFDNFFVFFIMSVPLMTAGFSLLGKPRSSESEPG